MKSDPAFRAVGSERTLAAIDEALEGQPWTRPRHWGAFFLLFPTHSTWDVPTTGWHIDWAYTDRLSPPCGVKMHAMLSDVEPRAGGMNILDGSHRLVHQWFREHPAASGARSAQLRKSLFRHPLSRTSRPRGARDVRIARFHDRVEVVDGIPLQVVENVASAGEVILMHSLLLHAAPAAHLGAQPRFLLNQDLHPTGVVWPTG